MWSKPSGFFELADIEKKARDGEKGKPISPIAIEAVLRLDALFEIERAINGQYPEERRAVRQEKSKPLFDDMHVRLLRERETLSRSAEVLKPINYMLKRWSDFARFLNDGRICLSNNAAERSLRGVALGRRNWTFAGSQRAACRPFAQRGDRRRETGEFSNVMSGENCAATHNLQTSRLHELLPWEWSRLHQAARPVVQQVA